MLSLWILVAGVVVWRLYTSFSHLSRIPKQIPWAQSSGRFTPYLLEKISGIWKTPKAINEAYQKYNRNGVVCAIALPFSRPEILLRRSLIHWMTSQKPFGFGKHACPGRHFAAVETKLFLAYLPVHYDLKQIHERPGFVSLGRLPIPPIQRKAESSKETEPFHAT